MKITEEYVKTLKTPCNFCNNFEYNICICCGEDTNYKHLIINKELIDDINKFIEDNEMK